jgi:hypothetical protein
MVQQYSTVVRQVVLRNTPRRRNPSHLRLSLAEDCPLNIHSIDILYTAILFVDCIR